MAFIEVKGTGRSSLSAKAILTGIFSLKGDVRTGIISQALPMAIHNEDFLPTLQHLLPPGSLWTKLADAELTKLLRAISYSFTNVLRRGKNLIDEADPRTTNELLPDWERLLALPECTPGPTALEERRNEVVSKLNGFKDPNTQNIIDLASELGYTISIRTFKPFVAGSRAGDRLYQHPWQFAWRVETWGGLNNALLECILATTSPRHTSKLHSYFYSSWKLRTPDSSFTGTFNGVTYSVDLNLFCAVGALGQIQTSPDGIIWTTRTPGSGYTGGFDGVTYSENLTLLCAVGSTGGLQTSPDGISWTKRTSGGGFFGTFKGITYSEDLSLFCAVGSSGEIQTSPDGITWTARTAADSYTGVFAGVVYGSGLSLFCAVGSSGEIQTSPDGITWTARTAADSYISTFRGLSFDNNLEMFCAVGAPGEIQTSLDGITWISQMPSGSFANILWGATFGDNRMFLVGDGGEIQYSEDGEVWFVSEGLLSTTLRDIAFDSDNYIFCAVGNSGQIQTANKV